MVRLVRPTAKFITGSSDRENKTYLAGEVNERATSVTDKREAGVVACGRQLTAPYRCNEDM